MKKFFVFIIAAAIIVPVLNSCKKGPNDPGISLKSRDGRIIAIWTLSSIEGTSTEYSYFDSTYYTTSITYTGSMLTEMTSPGGTMDMSTGQFKMTLDKDGSYSYTETYTPDGGDLISLSGIGYWYWADSDKNKVGVTFTNGGSFLFFPGTYRIDKLSSKELVLVIAWEDTVDGIRESGNATFTFTAS